MSLRKAFRGFSVLNAWAICGLAGLRGGEPPATVRIGEGERLVHVVASPFTHDHYLPRLEAMLLQGYAPHGLKYRRVKAIVAELVANLDSLVLVHRPTLVMIQTGNWDLLRERHYVFTEFPRHLEQVVATLTAKRIRVIVCSPTPVGSESTKDRLLFPLDGMGRWVEAARLIAARHGAVFVDLFSDALGWPMPGPGRASFYYTPEQHRQSFELLQRQLRFEGFESRSPAQVPADLRALQAELERGHQLAAALSQIHSYALPVWLALENFSAQKDAARQDAERRLEDHDARIGRMFPPQSRGIPIKPEPAAGAAPDAGPEKRIP